MVDYVPPPPDPPAEGEILYPLTYTPRGSSRNPYQDDPESLRDRLAIGMMDACHTIGFDSGTTMDSTPPANGWISRTQGNGEILGGDLGSDHYLCTYVNVTEAFADGNATTARAIKIRDYIDAMPGPNGSEGWCLDEDGNKVILFGSGPSAQMVINLSDHVGLVNGETYPEWYFREMVQIPLIDVHAAAGIGVGKGGINCFHDNFQHHSNKQGLDWDASGVNNNAQNFWDTLAPSHHFDDKSVASITRSGSVATVTMNAPHPLEAGQQEHIRISGADQSAYNGDFDDSPAGDNATVINNLQFTYNVTGSPATPATGNILLTALDNNSEPRSIASESYASVRTNMKSGWDFMMNTNPGILMHLNSNQHADQTEPGLRNTFLSDYGDLRDVILEFRLDGDPDQSFVQAGFSENNVQDSFPRSGIRSDGTNHGTGSFESSYFHMLQSVRHAQFPAMIVGGWGADCLQNTSYKPPGDFTQNIYENVPHVDSNWNLVRYGIVMAWLAGAHAAVSGHYQNGSGAGGGKSTPLFEEYGLINGRDNINGFGSGPTKLYPKWMGAAIDPSPQVAAPDGTYKRRFEHAIIIANPDNSLTGSSILVDVSAFGDVYTRFQGSAAQDDVFNNGNALSSDFLLGPQDAGVFPLKSWYDTL